MPGVQELSSQALDDQLQRVAERLGRKYGDRAGGSEIESAVYQEAERYRDARVKQYIPVLVQHAVQERLRRRRPIRLVGVGL
jgi:ribosome assembly protein YihI (activator of Der GTPase)